MPRFSNPVRPAAQAPFQGQSGAAPLAPQISDFLKTDRDAEALVWFTTYEPLVALWQKRVARHDGSEPPPTFKEYAKAIARRPYNSWAQVAKKALARLK
jgi:hypothetical protein